MSSLPLILVDETTELYVLVIGARRFSVPQEMTASEAARRNAEKIILRVENRWVRGCEHVEAAPEPPPAPTKFKYTIRHGGSPPARSSDGF
jgi:hypothetical protein